MNNPQNQTTTRLRRQNAVTRGLLEALALLMAPSDANMGQFDEYLEHNELGLALEELSAMVNQR